MVGSLYIVSTPIGNLEDISQRALKVITDVSFLAVEDTRISGRLLKRYNIENKMIVYNNFNETKKHNNIIELIKEGNDVALLSDAGTPCISDPGFRLVNSARKEKINIYSIPGPSAVIAALSTSGLPSDTFYFEGFLPKKKGRQTKFDFLINLDCTIVIYESPKRISKTISDIKEYFGEKRIVSIQREITKMYEEVFTGSVIDAYEKFYDKNNKGEFVIVIANKNFIL